MHFLCLHGQGTSSEIFSTQTVSLRYELGPTHTYEFLEGIVPAPLAEELRTYYSSSTRTWNYFDLDNVASITTALEQLHDFIALEGPFDGVIGYSHGAAFAATYILQQAAARPPVTPFKCAVFFSAGRPAELAALEKGVLKLQDGKNTEGGTIDIPTAHVWGANDTLHPDSWVVARELSREEIREEVVHQEGHDIPGGKARDAVLQIAKAIRRTVARAEGIEVDK